MAASCQVYKSGANSDYTQFKKVKYEDKEKQTTLLQAVLAHLSVWLHNLHTGRKNLPSFPAAMTYFLGTGEFKLHEFKVPS